MATPCKAGATSAAAVASSSAPLPVATFVTTAPCDPKKDPRRRRRTINRPSIPDEEGYSWSPIRCLPQRTFNKEPDMRSAEQQQHHHPYLCVSLEAAGLEDGGGTELCAQWGAMNRPLSVDTQSESSISDSEDEADVYRPWSPEPDDSPVGEHGFSVWQQQEEDLGVAGEPNEPDFFTNNCMPMLVEPHEHQVQADAGVEDTPSSYHEDIGPVTSWDSVEVPFDPHLVCASGLIVVLCRSAKQMVSLDKLAELTRTQASPLHFSDADLSETLSVLRKRGLVASTKSELEAEGGDEVVALTRLRQDRAVVCLAAMHGLLMEAETGSWCMWADGRAPEDLAHAVLWQLQRGPLRMAVAKELCSVRDVLEDHGVMEVNPDEPESVRLLRCGITLREVLSLLGMPDEDSAKEEKEPSRSDDVACMDCDSRKRSRDIKETESPHGCTDKRVKAFEDGDGIAEATAASMRPSLPAGDPSSLAAQSCSHPAPLPPPSMCTSAYVDRASERKDLPVFSTAVVSPRAGDMVTRAVYEASKRRAEAAEDEVVKLKSRVTRLEAALQAQKECATRNAWRHAERVRELEEMVKQGTGEGPAGPLSSTGTTSDADSEVPLLRRELSAAFERSSGLALQVVKLEEQMADTTREYNALSTSHCKIADELNETRDILLSLGDKHPGTVPVRWFCVATQAEVRQVLEQERAKALVGLSTIVPGKGPLVTGEKVVTQAVVQKVVKLLDETLRNPHFDPFVRRQGGIESVDHEDEFLSRIGKKHGQLILDLLLTKRREIEEWCPSGHYPTLGLWDSEKNVKLSVPDAVKILIRQVLRTAPHSLSSSRTHM